MSEGPDAPQCVAVDRWRPRCRWAAPCRLPSEDRRDSAGPMRSGPPRLSPTRSTSSPPQSVGVPRDGRRPRLVWSLGDGIADQFARRRQLLRGRTQCWRRECADVRSAAPCRGALSSARAGVITEHAREEELPARVLAAPATPRTATHRGRDVAAAELLAGLGVEDRDRAGPRCVPRAEDRPRPRARRPYDHRTGCPMKRAVFDRRPGTALGGSSTPPMPTPPSGVAPRADLAQLPTVAQVSTMVRAPTHAPTFT